MMFKQLEKHLDTVDISMTIAMRNGKIIVSVLPQMKCEDESKRSIVPILMKGTAEELDLKFLSTLQTPIEKASGISSSLIEFEESLKKVESESKEAKVNSDKVKKLQEKADKELVKAETYVDKKEYGKAILKIKAALKFAPKYSKAINRLEEVQKLDVPDMFSECGDEPCVEDEVVKTKSMKDVAIDEGKQQEVETKDSPKIKKKESELIDYTKVHKEDPVDEDEFGDFDF